MKSSLRTYLPLLLTVVFAAWLVSKAIPARDDDGAARVHEFGRLPVVYQGRIKPYDTLAHNSLVILSDRQTWRNAEGRRRPAIEWLLDVMSGTPRAATHKVFRIHNLELLTQLGMERRKGYRYAYEEFADLLPAVEEQVAHAMSVAPAERDVYDAKVLEFWQRVVQFRVLVEINAIPDPQGGVDTAFDRLRRLEQFALPHSIPPTGEGEQWTTFLRSLLQTGATPEANPALRPFAGALAAWAAGDVAEFNEDVDALEDVFASLPNVEYPPLAYEAWFNGFAPFYHCAVLYVVAFLVGCLAWLGAHDVFRRTAFWLIALAFVGHTFAIASRIYISGYPPITNLYGTAIFIGWACALLGILLECIYRLGVGNLLAATVGFLTLLIAHFLAGDGDTLEMMQAVLDTKFWLATHVIVINFGYAATFLAGGLSVLYILRGVLTRSLDRETERAFGRMTYGVLCFALLLSFVGTVLGGLWADDSWGRFWGWDPKENGALMIVLWNALILHARWAGMGEARGIAVLAIFGNIITAWSWFGVTLGVGLHSYGFTDSVAFWLVVFVASAFAVMAMGLVPRSLWRSGKLAPTPRRAAVVRTTPSGPDTSIDSVQPPDAGSG